MMLLKLQAYVDKTNIKEEVLQDIEKEKKKIGFSRDIDEILNELNVQIPRRKTSNIRKKEKQPIIKQQPTTKEFTDEEITEKNIQEQEKRTKLDYEETIKKYKEEIAENPHNSVNKRNLLAFTYYRAGRLDEARDELLSLIEQGGSYTAYRQLIYIEKNIGNLDDAKFWAYDAIDNFPDSTDFREQLISIAREEGNNKEIMKQLKEIMRLNRPRGLKLVNKGNER